MSRIPRNYIKTSFFHVITQGINKSYIFERAEDIKYYIKIMYQLTQEQKIKIIGYCIMSNHAHMLIETEEINELSKYMQRLNTKYGKYYNKKYNRVGYVFRDRYRAQGIYTEKFLYNCLRYIYNNPVKAGICKNAEDYPYSNYKKIDGELNEDYTFIDIEDNDKNIGEIIKKFLKENEMELTDLKREKRKLKELVIILKKQYNISLRNIAKELHMGRETIRKLYDE